MYYKNAIKICNVLSGSVEAVDSSRNFTHFSDMVIVLLKEITFPVVNDSSCRLTHHIMQKAVTHTVSVYKSSLCVTLYSTLSIMKGC